MEQCKMFTGSEEDYEEDGVIIEKEIEKKINKWLKKKGNTIKITQRLQSVSSSDPCIITIFYEKTGPQEA